jgi:hypothetical protein
MAKRSIENVNDHILEETTLNPPMLKLVGITRRAERARMVL